MEIKWLLTLIGIVLLAGCVGIPGGTQQTKGIASGVVIKSFYAVNPEIYSGDTAYFSFTLENIGGSDANVTSAKLYGLGSDWNPSTVEMKDIGILNRADPTAKLPGGTYSDEFSSTSPENLKVDTTYTAFIRVTYTYNTSAEGKIKFYNKTYLNSLSIEEARKIRSSPGIESFVTTSGAPIQISLTGLPRPLEDGKGKVTFIIENVGPGKNYLNTIDDRTVKIINITIGGSICSSLPGLSSEPQKVILPRVGPKLIVCDVPSRPVDTYTTIPVKAEIMYNYFVDASTTIKVLRTPS
jgi:hypothetical protein